MLKISLWSKARYFLTTLSSLFKTKFQEEFKKSVRKKERAIFEICQDFQLHYQKYLQINKHKTDSFKVNLPKFQRKKIVIKTLVELFLSLLKI